MGSLASDLALVNGAPIDDIVIMGNWSSPEVFNSRYRRTRQTACNITALLIPFISYGCAPAGATCRGELSESDGLRQFSGALVSENCVGSPEDVTEPSPLRVPPTSPSQDRLDYDHDQGAVTGSTKVL